MNIQPLYDVKARLEQAAVAGVGLLNEDFRLARAAQALEPLAAASPVFAKIRQGLQALPNVPAAERGAALLDVLALVDAVVYTQAKTGATGELGALPVGTGTYRQASYSQMQPLLSALTTSGGGRMETVRATWEAYPELFTDYRVLPALVSGLGDSYGDIADQNAKILEQLGPVVLPLLKQGFEPAGKKDMARRVQVMDEIAGAAENEWYLKQLPKAKKVIRQVLLLALRRAPANAPLLAQLCETEKTDCQTAARYALAYIGAPESLAYLKALGEKDKCAALDAMRYSSAPAVNALSGEWMIETMAQVRENPGLPLTEPFFHLLEHLRLGMECKAGPEICEAYRQAAAIGTALDRDYSLEQNGKTKQEPMLFYCRGAASLPGGRRPFSAAMPFTLIRSIQLTRDPGLCALAEELAQTHGGPWGAPALCASLFTDDSETTARKLKEMLLPKFKLFAAKKSVPLQATLQDVLWGLYWDTNHNRYEYATYANNIVQNLQAYYKPSERPVLPQMLHPAWFELLMKAGGMNQQLMNLIQPMDHPVMGQVCEHLYAQAMHGQDPNSYVTYVHTLKRCGWTNWDDFYVKWARAQGTVWFYSVQGQLNALPISGQEKAAQLKKITDLNWAKKIKPRSGTWPDARVKEMIAEWEAEPSPEAVGGAADGSTAPV